MAAIAHEFRVGVVAGGLKPGDVGFRLLTRETLVNQFENLVFGLANVFQAADLRAGQSGQTLLTALDDDLNHGIRKADQFQHHGVAAEGIELVCLRHLENLRIGVSRAGQRNNGIAAREFVIVIARRLQQREAQLVAGAGLFQLGEIANFRSRDIHLLDLREIGGPHPRLIERGVVNLRFRLAARKSEFQKREE